MEKATNNDFALAIYLEKRFSEIGDALGTVINYVTESEKKRETKEALEKKAQEEMNYGAYSSIVENVNIYKEKIHGEPRKTPITSIHTACRLVGEEDLISVLTEGLNYFIGRHAGKSMAEITDRYKPLSETKIPELVAGMSYGPRVDLEDKIIDDIENAEKAGKWYKGAEMRAEGYSLGKNPTAGYSFKPCKDFGSKSAS